MSRRVLVVTYAFPPSRSVGALRWATMSKYLGRLGFEITVITSRLAGGLPQPEVPLVIRPADLESWGSLRDLLGRPEAAARSNRTTPDRPAGWTKVVVPDGWLLTWAPFALLAARREVRAGRVDCIVTTSPAESTHLIGLNLRRLGPAWVADFRDGWIFEPARPTFSPRLLDSLDQRLESTVVKAADRVVAVTEDLAADFRDRTGVDALCIPNGWDPETNRCAELKLDRRPAAGKVRLVYTGTLGAGTTLMRRPEPFFAALERLQEREPELAARLEVVVAGQQTARDSALLRPLAGHGVVVELGEVTREVALQLQRSADAVLLWAHGSAASMKLFEYLAAGRPILHVGGEGAASRILRETGSGVSVRPDDIDGIVDKLRELARGSFGRGFEPHGIEQYSYPPLAERMATVIEDAIRHRQADG